MLQRNLTLILLGICLLFIANLVRSFQSLGAREKVIKDAKKELTKEIEEQDALKKQLERVENKYYVEKQAREKLNLGKSDEIVVVLPSISPFREVTPTPTPELKNWEKWAREFY